MTSEHDMKVLVRGDKLLVRPMGRPFETLRVGNEHFFTMTREELKALNTTVECIEIVEG